MAKRRRLDAHDEKKDEKQRECKGRVLQELDPQSSEKIRAEKKERGLPVPKPASSEASTQAATPQDGVIPGGAKGVSSTTSASGEGGKGEAGTGHEKGDGGGNQGEAGTVEKLVRVEEWDKIQLELLELRGAREDLEVARRELAQEQLRCSEAVGQVASLRSELSEARAQAQRADLARAHESTEAQLDLRHTRESLDQSLEQIKRQLGGEEQARLKAALEAAHLRSKLDEARAHALSEGYGRAVREANEAWARQEVIYGEERRKVDDAFAATTRELAEERRLRWEGAMEASRLRSELSEARSQAQHARQLDEQLRQASEALREAERQLAVLRQVATVPRASGDVEGPNSASAPVPILWMQHQQQHQQQQPQQPQRRRRLDQPSSAIVDFFRGVPSACPYSIGQVLQATDHWLERTHDYIQWVFPLEQVSRYNPLAPVLTREDREAFRLDSGGERAAMLAAMRRMLQFYGLEEVPGENGQGNVVELRKASNFAQQVATTRWTEPNNHNALRLTRMITSLGLAHLQPFADALRHCLLSLPELQGHPSLAFWAQA